MVFILHRGGGDEGRYPSCPVMFSFPHQRTSPQFQTWSSGSWYFYLNSTDRGSNPLFSELLPFGNWYFYRNCTKGCSNHFFAFLPPSVLLSNPWGRPCGMMSFHTRRVVDSIDGGPSVVTHDFRCFSCRLYPRNREICFAGGSSQHLGHSSTISTKKVIRLSRGLNPGYFGLIEFLTKSSGKFSLFPHSFLSVMSGLVFYMQIKLFRARNFTFPEVP